MLDDFYSIKEASMPMFVDSYLVDEGRLLFCSLWGGETAMQEFLARLTLPEAEFGLREFTLLDPDDGRMYDEISVGNAAELSKLTARTPSTTVLGSLCHVWLYDPVLQKHSAARRERYLLMRQGFTSDPDGVLSDIWSAIKELCHIPLMDVWERPITAYMTTQTWLYDIEGVGGVDGLKITIPEQEFTEAVQAMLRDGTLSLDPAPPTPNPLTPDDPEVVQPEKQRGPVMQSELFGTVSLF